MTGEQTDHVSVRPRALSSGWVRLAAIAIVGIALLWLGGLLAFIWRIEHASYAIEPHAEGIVVLTGGADRLNVGINLLQRGQAQRLLITGVHPEIRAEDLSDVTIGTKQLFECCVDLGKSARNTRGNALEAATWARTRNYRRLIVVTANYHMPRSLLEFRAAMPGDDLIAYPVAPPELKLGEWWLHPGTTSLLAGEYSKYLLSLVRIGPAFGDQLQRAQAS